MASSCVSAGWARRSLDRQVEEALVILGEINPQRWAGGFTVGQRPYTTEELADQLLIGGAHGATGRAVTFLTDRARRAGTVWAALLICVVCATHDVTTTVTRAITGHGTIATDVCARCAQVLCGSGWNAPVTHHQGGDR